MDCEDTGYEVGNCNQSSKLKIEYKNDCKFSDNDFIEIDGLRFYHTYYNDSITNYNFLPKEKVIMLEVEGKQGAMETNKIAIAMTLAKKLMKTKKYKILKNFEVMTRGKISLTRNDGEEIKICTSEDYKVVINEIK